MCGLRQGRGILKRASGEAYEGDFWEGVLHGEGMLRSPVAGFVYVGEFRDGRATGWGKMQYLGNGSTYEGHFVEWKRHGTGKLVYASGAVYEGGFKDNGLDGMFTYTSPDGTFTRGRCGKEFFRRELARTRESIQTKDQHKPSSAWHWAWGVLCVLLCVLLCAACATGAAGWVLALPRSESSGCAGRRLRLSRRACANRGSLRAFLLL